MDPDAALAAIRTALARFRPKLDEGEPCPACGYTNHAHWCAEVGDLADAFEGLDEWLSKGGFLPDAWKKPEPEQIIRAVFTTEDVEGIAADNNIDLETALDRAREWGKAIGDTLVSYGNEQLESVILTGNP